MKRSITLTLLLSLMLSGCASIFSTPVPGTPAEEVIALKGSPDAEYLDGNIRLLEWSVGPWAQYAYMAKSDGWQTDILRAGSDTGKIRYHTDRSLQQKRRIENSRPSDRDRLFTPG